MEIAIICSVDIHLCMSKFDWNHALAFWTTVEEGSLSAAARKLGLTQPTLSRQVAALEQSLGVTLFERLGKSLMLTEAGLDLIEHVRAMGAAAETVRLAASGQTQSIEGRVTISASDGFAAYVLPDIVHRIRQSAPQITLEIVASNALSDLRRREADIAIRHVRPDQPDLIGRLVNESEAHLYAAQSWVEHNGMPRHPADLAKAGFIGLGDGARLAAHLQSRDLPVTETDFILASENSVVVWELVKRGLGISFQMQEIAARTPGMVRLLPQIEPFPVPIWLVTHRELRTSRRIRTVFDLLAEGLAVTPRATPSDSAPRSRTSP